MIIAAKRAYSTVAAQANSIAVRASGTGAPFEKFAIVQLSPTPEVKYKTMHENICFVYFDRQVNTPISRLSNGPA